MRRPYVKVCGIVRPEDAEAAVRAGADAIGFVFAKESPRWVDPETAAAIVRDLPGGTARVGVFVNRPAGEVRRIAARVGLTAVQAHGDESPRSCRAYRMPTVKAFPTPLGFDLEKLAPFRAYPILLDGHADLRRGGTGRMADWALARRAREAGYRVLLAGGLDAANLRQAVETISPIAVDLNSGVERSPGVKDPDRIRRALASLDDLDPSLEETWPW